MGRATRIGYVKVDGGRLLNDIKKRAEKLGTNVIDVSHNVFGIKTSLTTMLSNSASKVGSDGFHSIDGNLYRNICKWIGVPEYTYLYQTEDAGEDEEAPTSQDEVVGTLKAIYKAVGLMTAELRQNNDLLRSIIGYQKNEIEETKNNNPQEMQKVINQIASDTRKSLEKITAIFTEVKYNR